jgi:putative hydrolase of HD superfamily
MPGVLNAGSGAGSHAMRRIADLLFEARILKELPRSGYHFLGSGRESVAEHVYFATFVGYVLAQMCPDVDGAKIVHMCLMHDLGEARTGDLNYVQKKYVRPDEVKALADLTDGLAFGEHIKALCEEFRKGETQEAKLAHDADQLALVAELKALCDVGQKGPETWMPYVVDRLKTEAGRRLALELLETPSDRWWFHE